MLCPTSNRRFVPKADIWAFTLTLGDYQWLKPVGTECT
jgi:hypothetical protein